MRIVKGDLDIDRSGVIREAYRIDGIGLGDCRTIFFDWALGLAADADPKQAIRTLLDRYGTAAPDHPMTLVLREGLGAAGPARRRGGWRGRRPGQAE